MFDRINVVLNRWNIPNLITGLNLLSGCIALVLAFEGKLVTASAFIGLGLMFDFLDGFAARLLNIKSNIGRELDSLADVVTFGVVPGVLIYQLIQQDTGAPHLNAGHTDVLPYIGFLLPVFSAFRLAKFNLDDRQQRVFYGLPTPAMAIFFGSFPLILELPSTGFLLMQDLVTNFYVLSALTILFSWLMVSDIPLFSLKFETFQWKDNRLRYLFLGFATVAIILLKVQAFPLIILTYVLASLLFGKHIGS